MSVRDKNLQAMAAANSTEIPVTAPVSDCDHICELRTGLVRGDAMRRER